MPSRPKQYCTKGGCVNFRTIGTRCDTHQVKPWRTSVDSSSNRGYGHGWRKIRSQVIERDKGLCQSCLCVGIVTAGTDVDHIKPKTQGGNDTLSNLQLLCSTCHKQKTARER